MEKNNPSAKVADNDVDITGMHFSEITGFLKPDPVEVIVNEQEQNETVNQDEDEVNGSD